MSIYSFLDASDPYTYLSTVALWLVVWCSIYRFRRCRLRLPIQFYEMTGFHTVFKISTPLLYIWQVCYYLAPHRGRARDCNAHVCLFVCLFVCVFVRVFVIFQSVISQPFLNRSLWNLAYILRMGTPWLTNRSKVKVVGRRKVKNVIWPYLGNEWS